MRSEKFIAIKIVPGEKLRKRSSITESPLVPPSKREWGKINKTVLKPYKALPMVIKIKSLIDELNSKKKDLPPKEDL